MIKAVVHTVSPNLADGERTFVAREPLDCGRAEAQHADYCRLLQACGAEVVRLSANAAYPDAVFIEDTAVVFDEIAVIGRFGVPSRRGEERAVAEELAKYRRVVRIEPPATLEGGDVVCLGSTVFVGQTPRTNEAGLKALRQYLRRYEYEVIPVAVRNCLHLKSACCPISERSLLVNPHWVDLSPFAEFNVITVAETEPWAANAIRVNQTVCLHAGFPETAALLRQLDFQVETVDVSELLKAEGGLSCLSLRFEV